MNEVVIKKSVSGAYECKAVSETGRAIKLLVPVSTYSKILEHVVPNKFDVAIRWLFEAKYDQHEPDLGVTSKRIRRTASVFGKRAPGHNAGSIHLLKCDSSSSS